MLSFRQTLNRLFLSYMILKPTFTSLFWGFDGAGHTYMILLALILYLNIRNRFFWQDLKNTPILIWLVWCFYATIVWLVIGKNSTPLPTYVFIFNKIFLPFSALFLTYHETKKDPDGICKTMLYSFLLYTILGVLFQNPVSAGKRGGELLGNDLPLGGICMLATAAFYYVRGLCSKKLFFCCTLFCTYAIFFVATRKALIGELLILSALIYAIFDIRRARDVLLLLFAVIFIYWAYSYIMDYTVIGKRLMAVDDSAKQFNTSGYEILDLVGDRAYFYINGWKFFLKSPIFGIGLRNFPIEMHTHLPIHSEYVVQLCEMGITGCVLYMAYIYSVLQKIKAVRLWGDKKVFILFWGWMAALLFISLTAWTYEFSRYFIVTGIFIGYSNWIQNSNEYEDCTYNH